MNDRSLFAPAPRRKRGLILMVAGSLLFHGSLIGVAALWPVHPKEPAPYITTDLGDEPVPAADPQTPAAPPSEAEPEAPVLKAVEPVEDQPPVVEPSIDDMSQATPTPRPAARAASRPNPALSTLHTVRTPGSLSTGGPASGTAGIAGAGHPGSGVRWNVPRPAYPAALRLAHVQGSGKVRVTTDGAGRVVDAVIVQSTGSFVLDDQTCRTAKLQWSGPANATTTVPITYQLQ